jgi:hypothetical protein
MDSQNDELIRPEGDGISVEYFVKISLGVSCWISDGSLSLISREGIDS